MSDTIRWARKLNPARIRRLCETDAVVAFLDALTYGDGSTPGLKEQHAEWREKAATT